MGQYLTALGMGLSSINESSPSCSEIRRLQKLTEVMGQEVHRLALELRPATLDDLGLGIAVQNYLEAWAERSGIEIDYLNDNLEGSRLPTTVETVAYRIIQESLTNVLRHAEAKRVSILIRRSMGFLFVSVEDDGKGFDADGIELANGTRKRLGLLGMDERVSLLGGTFEVESSPGKGTGIVARIPLDKT
jgi:signal transduction histidine kinase